MPWDLRLHWWMVSLGLRKKCPHKKRWQQIRARTKDRTYVICCGCLMGWHVDHPEVKNAGA